MGGPECLTQSANVRGVRVHRSDSTLEHQVTNAKKPSLLREFLWAAIASFTVAFGSWAIVWQGEQTGEMKFGRASTVVSRVKEPDRFEHYATFFNISTVAFSGLGCVCLAAAWKVRRAKQVRTNELT